MIDLDLGVILQALIVAGVTAIVAGYINGMLTASHLKDLKERVARIEKYLNGLLRQ